MRITDELTKRQILERRLKFSEDEVARLKAKNELLRVALEELIGAAEHCGDGDVPVVIKARAALC